MPALDRHLKGSLLISSNVSHKLQMKQMLWAVDLKLTHSDSLAQMKLMKYVTNGTFDGERSVFEVPITINQPRPSSTISRRRKTIVHEEVLISFL